MKRAACWLSLVLAGLWLWPSSARAQACSYSINGPLNFGTITGVPTPQIDVTATVNVQCGALYIGTVRTCLGIPGANESGGARLMTLSTGESVRFQLYRDAARTQVLGAYGETSAPLTIDVPVLIYGSATATLYGRVFANQDDKPVGNYSKTLSPIYAREQAGTGTPCESVGGTPYSVSPVTATLRIDPMCTVAADPLNFGSFSSLSADRDASTNLRLDCTLKAPYQISLNGGGTGNVANRRMSQAGNPATVSYQLYSDTARSRVWGNTSANWVAGTGTGTSQVYTVYGRVPAQSMPSTTGTFEDTVTVTVSY